MNEVMIYSDGLLYCSVCAPKDMPIEAVTNEVNRQQPTGITSQWQLSKDETFKNGEPNPCPCEKDNTRLHYLFNC